MHCIYVYLAVVKCVFQFRLKKIEQEMDNEEKARGQVTGELRIKKTQHMTTSRFVTDVQKTRLAFNRPHRALAVD